VAEAAPEWLICARAALGRRLSQGARNRRYGRLVHWWHTLWQLNFATGTCRYWPLRPKAFASAVTPAVSAKGKLKITSSAPASM
jgi:hypothetical protein